MLNTKFLDLNKKNCIFEKYNESIMQLGAKPFVKWAGGKTSLLSQIDSWLPHDFLKSEGTTYVEPFVGGGALLFHLLKKYPSIKKVIINDINEDLITCYLTIRNDPTPLIKILSTIEKEFTRLDEVGRRNYYYSVREKYNRRRARSLTLAAYFVFLNHTCFNGLYRVNSKSAFNVPFGRSTTGIICDYQLLEANHELFSNVDLTILCGSYEDVLPHIDDYQHTFIYLDPPYLPISVTSYFKQYSNSPFGIKEQEELKLFCDNLNNMGCRFMLSNSDYKTEDNQSYFARLYDGYECHMVDAKRFISAHGKRGKGTAEVLIRNYK